MPVLLIAAMTGVVSVLFVSVCALSVSTIVRAAAPSPTVSLFVVVFQYATPSVVGALDVPPGKVNEATT